VVTAVGQATQRDIGSTIRLRLDRPQLFDPTTGSRIA